METGPASKQPLLLLASKTDFDGLASFYCLIITSSKKYILEFYAVNNPSPFSVEQIHLRDAFQMHFSTPSPCMVKIDCSNCKLLIIFATLLREELVAEYLKQNPEQDVDEADDQGGQRVPGQGENTK